MDMTAQLDSSQTYKLFVVKQTPGANLIYFDLFNASGSGVKLAVMWLIPVVSCAVAVTGLVSVDLFLQRTTAIGTGGTAATFNGTDPTASTISPLGQGSSVMPAGVTARLTPSGGATAGALIAWESVLTEELNAGPYFRHDLVRRGMMDAPPLMVNANSGISVVQGTVASVGTIGFDIAFRVVRN